MRDTYQTTHVLAFLAAVACCVVLSSVCIRGNPAAVDEFAHVPAGISYWQLGRHYIYRENPPLVRLLAALPVVLRGPTMSYAHATNTYRSEWEVGWDFMRVNGPRYHEYIALARCMILFLAVAAGLLIFVWGCENYGSAAGAAAGALWLLDPTVLAYAAIATVDVGAAAFGCLAAFLFWRFLRKPGWRQTVLAGLGLGLAQASKFTLLVLYPSLMALMLIARLDRLQPGAGSGSQGRPTWAKLCAIVALSLLTLNGVYRLDRVGRPLGHFDFKSQLLSGEKTGGPDDVPRANRFRSTWLAELPTPLPEDYVRGFDSQKWDEEFGFYRVSRGRLVHRGVWYSPLKSLFYKLPLGTLALLTASLVYWAIRSRRFTLRAWAFLLPGIAVIAVLCTQTGLNWPVRYSLPALPFLVLSTGSVIQTAAKHRIWKWAVAACIVWNVGTAFRISPHFLAYGNELVGGPEGARQEFGSGSYDVGQDLFRLGKWRNEHPDCRPVIVLYYGTVNPSQFSLNDASVPDSFLVGPGDASAPSRIDLNKPFYLAISSALLQGIPGEMILESGRTVRAFIRSPRLTFANAFARIGYTIYIFKVVPTSNASGSAAATPYEALCPCLSETTFEEQRRHTLL
jgi:4-amino-4-deoxy-L-arabinose transferase-like glycosyltransferase